MSSHGLQRHCEVVLLLFRAKIQTYCYQFFLLTMMTKVCTSILVCFACGFLPPGLIKPSKEESLQSKSLFYTLFVCWDSKGVTYTQLLQNFESNSADFPLQQLDNLAKFLPKNVQDLYKHILIFIHDNDYFLHSSMTR